MGRLREAAKSNELQNVMCSSGKSEQTAHASHAFTRRCYLVLHEVQGQSGALVWKLILATLPAQTLKVEGRPPVT